MAVYNKIYTKEKREQVNKYNKNLMEDYLLELKSQKKSQGTIDQHSLWLQRYVVLGSQKGERRNNGKN